VASGALAIFHRELIIGLAAGHPPPQPSTRPDTL
jgi:hypothetical protein